MLYGKLTINKTEFIGMRVRYCMKKIKFGSIEILGYIGGLIWIAVILLRGIYFSNNYMYFFLVGILPNLGAAWLITMFGKWIVLLICKQDYSIKRHFIICFGVLILAFVSELIHDSFLNSPFDICDIVITIIAQLTIFLIPIVIKDKSFKNNG